MNDTELDVRDSTGLSRRTVVRGAAWTLPVVSMAATAPAYAASCGSTTVAYTLDWAGGSRTTGVTGWQSGSLAAGTATVGAPAGSGAASVSVQFASRWINESRDPTNDRRDPNQNLTISAETNVGGLNKGKGLYIKHASPISGQRSQRQQITISFDRPVSGLSFAITDIDSYANQYWDRVELSAVSSTGAAAFTPTRVNGIVGEGTSDSPFRQSSSNTTFNANEPGGNVGISFASDVEVSTMTLAFWSAVSSGQQAIYLSDFSFTARAC